MGAVGDDPGERRICSKEKGRFWRPEGSRVFAVCSREVLKEF